METHGGGSEPPNPAEAAVALEATQAARRSILGDASPRWMTPVFALLIGGICVANALPDFIDLGVILLLVVALGFAAGRAMQETGIRYRYSKREQRRIVRQGILVGLPAVLLIIASSLLDKLAGLWWVWLPAGVLAGLTFLLFARLTNRRNAASTNAATTDAAGV